MRTLSTSLLKSTNEGSAYSFAAKMILREKRIWYDNYSESHLPNAFKASSGHAYYTKFQTYQPVPQCYYEYADGDYVGVFPENIDSSSAYLGFFSNLDTTESYNLGIYRTSGSHKTGPWSKAGIHIDSADGLTYIGYLDKTSGTYLRRTEITQVVSGGHLAIILSGSPDVSKSVSFTDASVKPFSDGGYIGLMYMYVDNGGIRCGVYETENTIDVTSPYRIMFPNQVAVDKDLIYSAMVSSFAANGKCFFYVTDPYTGCVYGIGYDILARVWGDSFVAVPSDLSSFKINDALYLSGKYLLSGQFGREGATFSEFDRNLLYPVYNQLLSSVEGKIFSYERAVLVSTIGDHASIFPNLTGSKLIYGSLNRYASADNIPSYGYSTNSLTIDQNKIIIYNVSESSGDASMDVVVANGADQLSNEPYLDIGNMVEVYFALMNESDTWDWVLWSTYIIAGKERDSLNKSLVIHLKQWGIYNLGTLTSPFYFEIQSKQIKYDPLLALDNLYVAPNGGIRRNKYFIDLWNNQEYSDTGVTGMKSNTGGGADVFVVTNTTTVYGVRTDDIINKFGGLMSPVLTDNLQIKIYGWSYTSVGTLANPTIGCRIRVLKQDGSYVTLTGTVSGSALFPQYTPDSESGAIPIIYNFTLSGNYTAGDKLLYIMLTITNASATGISTTYFERIELTSGSTITIPYKTNTPWTLDEQNGGITVPAPGRYFMMFSQSPYSAFNFNVQAKFEITKDTSDTHGKLEFGLIGLAEDEDNCIIAIYERLSQTLRIVKIRNSVETQLASATVAAMDTNTVTMMFCHRNGTFFVRYLKSGNEWSDSVLSYNWTAADGYMTKPDALMHVGVVGKKLPPVFFSNTFSNSSTYNLACIDDPDNYFQYFPSSNGKITINMQNYLYTSKTAEADLDRIYGPVQPRTMKQYAASTLFAYSNWGIECRLHRWDKGGTSKTTNADFWNEALISSDGGYAWTIYKTQWRVYLTKTTYEYGRSLFYSKQMSGMTIGLANKIFVSNGLKDLRVDNGEILTHSYMEPVYLYKTDIIKCVNFFACTDDENATIKDMISKICKISGVAPYFSGDLNYTSLALAAGEGFPLA